MGARVSKSFALLAAQGKTPAIANGSKRANKYGAVKTIFGDEVFDSRREAARWIELRHLQTAGEISGLERQVRFPLKVVGKLICTYVADFVYRDKAGVLVVEDSKGCRTREYITKAKLFAALHGFPIREV